MIAALLPFLLQLLDRLLPDEETRARAKTELLKAENQQALNEWQVKLSAIVAEGQSEDPWTSRARPSFLYVVYVLLLASIPMGIVHAFDAALAARLTEGFRAWLAAIPEPLIQLFGVVMLGYIGGRSWEKVRGAGR